LARDAGHVVALEVKNAFGQVASNKFDVTRPKEDKSGVTTVDVTQGSNGQLQGTPRPGGPPILPGTQLPPGHPAIPQGQ
jgi:hypothetical protein